VANLSTSTWNTKAKMNDQVTVTLPNAPLHHILFDKPPVMDIKAQTGEWWSCLPEGTHREPASA